MVFYPLQKSVICYRQKKKLTAIKLQIHSISIPFMVNHHHHHHHWIAWEQWRRGRQAGKTWARSTFANNKQHKAAGYCAAVARLPDKAKDLGCLFKIVSCLLSLQNCHLSLRNCQHLVFSVVLSYNAPLLTRHLKSFDSIWFLNYRRGTLIERIEKNSLCCLFSALQLL